MARKSRKAAILATNAGLTLAAPVTTPIAETHIYNTGGYARLSILETRDRKDSEALQNQKELLRRHIGEHAELRLREIYEDNGETGTNFDRPGFQRLMADVRTGKIDCIVVKDLSRFGRDYLEAGNYLENLFPFLGVRFISIGDGYDSADATTADCLKVALKNLVNQVYSKDISRKSGSVLRQKQKRGEFIGAYASYGYLRDPADPHRLIVDPDTAPIVQEIFKRKLAGMGNTAITRWLNESGVLSPCTYRYQKGIVLDKRFAVGTAWKVQTVKNILSSQVYLGHMVQGRRVSEYYAGRPDRVLPPEEWTIVEHTHPPLVDQETFDRVQTVLREKAMLYHENLGKYDALGKCENLLKGLVYCADCGHPLVRYKQVSHGKRVHYFYLCPNYAAQLERSGCTYKYLREDRLSGIIRALLTHEIELAVDATALAARLESGSQTSDRTEELRHAKLERDRLEALKKRLMQDYLSGVLDTADYVRLKERYGIENAALEAQLAALEMAQRERGELLTQRNPWLSAFAGRTIPEALTQEMVQAMVERVTVYTNERVEVTFRFRDERRILLEALAQDEEVAV